MCPSDLAGSCTHWAKVSYRWHCRILGIVAKPDPKHIFFRINWPISWALRSWSGTVGLFQSDVLSDDRNLHVQFFEHCGLPAVSRGAVLCSRTGGSLCRVEAMMGHLIGMGPKLIPLEWDSLRRQRPHARIGPTNTTTWLLDVRRSRVLWPDEATKLWGGPGMVLILEDCWSFGLLDSRLCDDWRGTGDNSCSLRFGFVPVLTIDGHLLEDFIATVASKV